MASPPFRALLTEALRQFADRGYTNEADLQDWLLRLRAALERELPTDEELRQALVNALGAVFARQVNRGGIQQRVPGVDKFTLDRIAPELRAELDRRIFAGIDLIKLNRAAAVEKTLQRFSGWISSAPPAGIAKPDLRGTVTEILKPVAQIKYERRRLATDQGHKLASAIAHTVAMGQGAIAAVWHDRGEFDHGYDARPEHLKRSGTVFLVKNSWAIEDGLITRGSRAKYTDEIEQPGELVYCSCFYEYVTALRALPPEFLTAKGRAWLEWEPGRHHDAAQRRTDAVPTQAQRAAGNYPKGHLRWMGLDISIETRKGEERVGIGSDGRPWKVQMPADYGYIRRTIGADDEQVDCYIGPERRAPTAWIVRQVDVDTGAYDEDKVLIRFGSRAEALNTYEAGFSDGRGAFRIGSVLEIPVEALKAHYAAA